MPDTTPTQRRLLDSIRKAKETTESPAPPAQPPAGAAPSKPKQGSTRRRSQAQGSGPAKQPEHATPPATATAADPYQRVQRVWPD